MNKIFNKVRKNRALALLLAFAMMLSILPLNTVNAEPITQTGITVEPTASSGVTDTTANHSNNNVLFAGTYQALGSENYPQMKLNVAGLDLTKYTDVTFDFKPSREGMSLHVRPYGKNAEGAATKIKTGTYGSSSHIAVTGGAGRQNFTDDLTKDGDNGKLASLEYFDIIFDGKQTASGNLEFILYSVTFSGDGVEPVVFGNDQPIEDDNTNTNPDEGGATPNPDEGGTTPNPEGGAPDVIPSATVEASTGYTVVNNADGSVTVTYDAATVEWNPLGISVSNSNKAVYSKVKFLISTESDMVLCITDAEGTYPFYRDHKEFYAADGKVPLVYDLAKDETGFQFFCDANGGTGEKTFTIHSIEFIDPSAPVVVPTVTGIDTTLAVTTEEHEGAVAAVKYTAEGYPLFNLTIANHDITKYTHVTFDYEMAREGMCLRIRPYDAADKVVKNGGHDPVNGKPITYDITTADGGGKMGNVTKIEFYVDANVNQPDLGELEFVLNAITFSGGTVEDVVIGTPSAPDTEEGDGKPVVKILNSTGYTVTPQEDGSTVIGYPRTIGYNTLNFLIDNCDITKYNTLEIDITPSWDGMNIGILGSDNEYLRSHYGGGGVVETGDRHTIKIPLTADLESFKWYIDCSASESPLPTAENLSFTIHSIKIIDPNALPESKANFTECSVGSNASAQITSQQPGGIVTFTHDGSDYVRLWTDFTDYTYAPGDVLVVDSADFIDADYDQIYFCVNGHDESTNLKAGYAKVNGNLVAFELPDVTGKDVTSFRFKVKFAGKTSATINGMYIWDKATYDKMFATKYDPAQVPQGIAVTYYDDIYSRGITWNTDNTVPTSALYYVEKTDTMTADTVDWASASVKTIEVTSPKAFEDYQGKVWHTFKATIEDLTPEAKYFFRVGSEEYGWSDVGSFTIEKASDKIDSLHFIHLTDTQEEQLASFKKYAKVVKSAYELMPNAAFLAHTGDQVNNGEKLSYNEEDPSKNVNDIRMQEWMDVLDAPKANLMNSVLMPTVGNHDCGQFVFTDRFNIEWADYQKDKEETPDINEDLDDMKTGGCYSVTYGEPENGVLIISLNTNQLWTSAFDTYQRVWLENTLETYKDYKWKIVQMHAGAITGGGHTNDGESKYLRKTIMPLFSKYEVDLVLQGHDHVYTRSRSMAYGVNPFETTDAAKPVYFDGHTPVYLSAEKKTLTVNGVERDVWVEPQGTHYITINASGGKRYTELDPSQLDPIIVEAEGENPLNPTDEDGKYGSMTGLDKPTFALVSIEGDMLVYDVYTYDAETNKSTMYDTFAVDKSSIRGYDPSNPHEGKEKVELYGLKVNLDNNTKKYDGIPVKLDLSGFNCSNPAIMDCAQFKYSIEVVSGGVDPVTNQRYRFNPGNLIYGHLPKEPGEYILKIELPQSNKDYWGETEIRFTITN